MSGEPDTPRSTGLVRSTLLSMLRMVELAEPPVEARPLEREETPVRESCDCGGGEFGYREPVLDEGESGFCDAPSADTWIACAGSLRRLGLSC